MLRFRHPRRVRFLKLVLGALTLFAGGPALAQPTDGLSNIYTFRALDGDDPSRAEPDFDDSSWPVKTLAEIDADAPIFWLRARIELEPELFARGRPVGVRFLALASCELYWNGEHLGSNGRVGRDRASEVPGLLDWRLPLPPETGPGSHAVALRCSAHHRGFDPYVGIYAFFVGDYLELATAGWSYSAFTLLSAGGLLAIGLFYGLTFLLADRSRSHLWLGIVAAGGGLLVIAESWRTLLPYTYDLHIWRLSSITALAWILSLGLLFFVVSRYPGSGARLFLASGSALTLLSLWAPGFDAKAALLLLIGLGGALLWTLRAMLVERRLDAGFTVSGAALCLGTAVWQQERFFDFYLFFTLAALCLFLLASHVLAGARERRRQEAVELRSARLEIELLRRHLQPHFLMNTLTALSELFEEAPDAASDMVQDLGREMRLLAEISKRSSIPVEQEVELCRAHLRVMARRREESLRLETEGLDPRASIPPAVFHTLLENALTHNAYGDGEAVFLLSRRVRQRRMIYRFEAPYRPRRPAPTREGTGMGYVRARLRESYGDDFRISSRPHLEGGLASWRTEIDLPVDKETG